MGYMRYTKLGKRQDGLVSIMVTIIIMVILSLIVLAFARLSQREQRQALDRQLNTQAFYAAETGINDVRSVISETAGAALLANEYTSDCDGFVNAARSAGLTIEPEIDADGVISYSCLLVDPSPPNIQYGSVEVGKSRAFPLVPQSGEDISSVTVSWRPTDATGHSQGSCPSSKFSLPSSWSSSCKVGILRVELVDYESAKSRDALIDDNFVAFFTPQSGSSESIAFSDGRGMSNQGAIRSGGCDSAGKCSVTITGINANRAFMRVSSLYQSVSIDVSAVNDSAGQLELNGVQALIDVTGRANDVLRRVQVRVPINNIGGEFPDLSVQSSGTICKLYSVAEPDTLINPNPACDIN